MAKKNSKDQPTGEIWVALKDTGSIFNDSSQGKSVTGRQAVKMKKTSKVALALRNNVLKELSVQEANALNQKFKEAVEKASTDSLSTKEKALSKKAQELAGTVTAVTAEKDELAKKNEELEAEIKKLKADASKEK